LIITEWIIVKHLLIITYWQLNASMKGTDEEPGV